MESTILNPNSLAFIALCNEYCVAVENARESERSEFIAEMLILYESIDLNYSLLAQDE